MKKPKIRFNGYTEDWEHRKLGDLMNVTSVKRIHQSDWTNSGVRFLRARDIVAESKNEEVTEPLFISQEKYDEYSAISGKVKKGDLLVTGVGTIGVPMLINNEEPIYFKDGNIIWFKNENVIDGKFFYYSFVGDIIQKFIKESAGTGTVGTYTIDSGRKTPIILPVQKEEQSQIGRYFSELDNLITLHQRKCEETKKLKKYMLQKMFPQNGKNVPEIRFSGFTDVWEQRKLGDIASRVQGNDGRMELPTLTISAANGWMDQEDRFSGNIAGKEQSNYTLLHKGELSYNHGNSKLAKYGTVFALRTYEEALVPRVYHSFKIDNGNADFIEYYFATKIPDRELGKLITSGARMDGLLNIGFDSFMGIEITVPTLKEQEKISEFFRELDNLITLHQRKCDELQNLKKFMLQNMFV